LTCCILSKIWAFSPIIKTTGSQSGQLTTMKNDYYISKGLEIVFKTHTHYLELNRIAIQFYDLDIPPKAFDKDEDFKIEPILVFANKTFVDKKYELKYKDVLDEYCRCYNRKKRQIIKINSVYRKQWR
jgi:hypothetical protein